MTTIDTSTSEPVASYTSELTGETFTVWEDAAAGTYLIFSSNSTRHTERTPYPTKAEALAALDRWRLIFEGDAEIIGSPPEGHVSLRDYMDAGCSPAEHPSVELLIEELGQRREGYRLAHARQTAAIGHADLRALAVPKVDDRRTDAERIAAARPMLTRAWWSMEILTDDDVAARFEAGLTADQAAEVAEERAAIALAAEHERRPFVMERMTLPAYTCGLTGEARSGDAIVLRAQGWRDEHLKELAGRLVFSPEAIRAVLSGEEVAA